jgi:hypothetical protein
MVTLTIGIMFLLLIAYTFGCEEYYAGGPRASRPPMKWFAIEKFRETLAYEVLNNSVRTS